METTTARKRSAHPMSYYRNMVKDLDYSEKLELMSFIIDSFKSDKGEEMTMEEMLEGYPYGRRYTKAELNAMLDEAERDFEAGLGIDDDDLWKEDEEEYERELAEEQKLQLEAVWEWNGLNKLVYFVKDDTIHIVGFWDTRMEPEEQAEKTK